MIEMTWELSELSTAPLTGDLFTVPAAFHPVAMKDLLSVPAAVSFKPPTASYGSGQPAPSAPVPMTPTPEGGVLRVGGGVSAPRLTGKVEPAYSPEARSAHVQGTVVLSVVVGSDGVAHELRVTRSLQPDLDQKAIEAVSQWKFQPGMKDGKPVNTMATIEVNFRLLDNPPTQ
jgi:TonB family protein